MSPATTVAGALVLGLATSVHCVGMCGALACGVTALPGGETKRLVAASGYHLGRIVSYALIGAICGALGEQPLKWFFDSPAVLLPWVLVVALLAVGLGLHKRLPRPKFIDRWVAKARMKAFRVSATRGGLALGLATPLLPCAPLYFLVFAPLLASGSALKGAELAAAFGIGTVPLLWGAQFSFHKLSAILSPKAIPRLQRGLAILAALVIAWRLHGTIPFGTTAEDADSAAERDLPSCCH